MRAISPRRGRRVLRYGDRRGSGWADARASRPHAEPHAAATGGRGARGPRRARAAVPLGRAGRVVRPRAWPRAAGRDLLAGVPAADRLDRPGDRAVRRAASDRRAPAAHAGRGVRRVRGGRHRLPAAARPDRPHGRRHRGRRLPGHAGVRRRRADVQRGQRAPRFRPSRPTTRATSPGCRWSR